MIKKFKDFDMDRLGCVMMKSDASVDVDIDENDVYDTPDGQHGIEREPHVTVLYGILAEVDTNDILDAVRKLRPPSVKFVGLDVFENDEFDVLMVRAESDDLSEMNAKLRGLPHVDTFPTYEPHMTIAYLKKGAGQKYKSMKVSLPEEPVLMREAIISAAGIKIYIELDER